MYQSYVYSTTYSYLCKIKTPCFYGHMTLCITIDMGEIVRKNVPKEEKDIVFQRFWMIFYFLFLRTIWLYISSESAMVLS